MKFEGYMADGMNDTGYSEYIRLLINKDGRLPKKTAVADIVMELLPIIFKIEDERYLKKILYK